jgi:4-diphosphocytidyl-2-C-methyl-D-erythritol kinase
MTGNRSVVVTAPAKINLGLEILGKRDDGYHEIRTIMATIGLVDTLRVTVIPDRQDTRIGGVDGVEPGDNLISKAVAAFADETGMVLGYDIDVDKRIPSPGGLGGASTDAASTLMALNATNGTPLPTERMYALAARIGSDVPFFLGSPLALARGTGTELEPLPSLSGFVVLIVPRIRMAAKTATLYGALEPSDFTDGSRTDVAVRAIHDGRLPDPALLANAFTRPLYVIDPNLASVAGRVLAAGAPHVAVSGAGPGHYVLCPDQVEADDLAETLRAEFDDDTLVTVAPLHAAPTSVQLAGPGPVPAP